MSKIKLTKNETGQYVHTDILISIKKITKIFVLLYNQSVSGPGMALLLDNTANALSNKKSTDIFTTEYVLQESKDEAAAAGTNFKPKFTLRSDAQDGADSENRFTKSLIRAKEGATEGITELIGIDITGTVLREDNGTY